MDFIMFFPVPAVCSLGPRSNFSQVSLLTFVDFIYIITS